MYNLLNLVPTLYNKNRSNLKPCITCVQSIGINCHTQKLTFFIKKIAFSSYFFGLLYLTKTFIWVGNIMRFYWDFIEYFPVLFKSSNHSLLTSLPLYISSIYYIVYQLCDWVFNVLYLIFHVNKLWKKFLYNFIGLCYIVFNLYIHIMWFIVHCMSFAICNQFYAHLHPHFKYK